MTGSLNFFHRLGSFGWRVLERFVRNKGFLLSGAVGYNALLSVVPLFAVLLVVLSHFVDHKLILDTVSRELVLVIPGQAAMITDSLSRFVEERELIGGIGFAVLLFFSSMAFRTLEDAMAVIFRHHERKQQRRLVVSALIPFAYITCIGMALLFLTLLTSFVQAAPWKVLRVLHWEFDVETSTAVFLEVLGFIGLVAVLSSFYHVMPMAKVRLRRALIGGIVAGILWELARRFLIWYFATISLINVIYGSLATVIIVLLSMEIAAMILLLGAQVIAELEESAEAGLPWYERPDPFALK